MKTEVFPDISGYFRTLLPKDYQKSTRSLGTRRGRKSEGGFHATRPFLRCDF
jgi:hypothetical protein